VVNLSETTPFTSAGFLKNINSVCALPFMALFYNTNRNIMPCCKFDRSKTSVGGQQTLLEMFHGDMMSNVRAQMKQGIKPSECQVCWDAESKNTTSLRNHAMTKFGDRLDQGWIDDPQLRSLDLSPGNLCNFSCRICDSTSSSKIALEEIKYTQDQNKKQYLRERFGFKTFHPYIDESYDMENDEFSRLRMIQIEIDKFASKTKEEKDEFLNNVKDICVHNQNLFLQYGKNSWRNLNFNTEMKQILNFLFYGNLEIT
jgi:hypothetical protein